MVLTQIDLATGEHTWRQEDKYFGNILHNDTYIFVQRNNAEVVAYNLQDLEVAWERDFSPFKNVSKILLSENYLIVHLSQDNTVVLENSSGGLFLDESSSLYSKLLYFNQDTSYFSVSDFSLLAYDHTTSTELWRHGSNGFEGEPYFDGDIIYIQTFYGQIQALNTLTGSLLWETKRPTSLIDAERVVSSFSVTEQYLFYLTQDAQLRVLNKVTGELVGKVNFSNSLFLLEEDIAEYYFEVAADANYVTVFFADSWQIFVFRFVG
jgi:outer membrane protein assembly factor BamB